MPITRIATAAIFTAILLMLASLYFQSPYQLWASMAGLGVITGAFFTQGQRHVITGFGLGIAVTLLREVVMYDAAMIQVTAPVYAAGYLFAVATTVSVRALIRKLNPDLKANQA
ncbi:hypothetical protein [Reinekea sp. G2M2-21]|uniref:hypothetical protein n=1 Tax=Reinekea sp. G2M2-21 TaxID=2788942 RepID=UPI0018AB5B8E|nr:hypothetical protein [Reinekea sp. G2M2-21]